MSWKQLTEPLRYYAYSYDNLSRLTNANYGEDNSATNRFTTSYSYDKHGNMKTLTRRGNTNSSGTNAMVDNLTMTYTGNQLAKVSDTGVSVPMSSSMDFKDYSNVATEYTYNANGAMNKDLNKGISDIQYNSLNLPRMMDIKSPVAEARNEYTYSASGQKLKVVQKWNPNYSTAPVIGSGINTAALTMTKTTDYVGNTIYENGNLKRILVDGGYIEGGVYHYYLNDHLGNNRVVVNQSGTVIQRNQYYPFGMSFAEGTVAEQGKQPYKYNGKELDMMHGLNMYDYSARFKDDWRFISVDPLAEKYYSWSPYVYCLNNPLKYIDPTGMDAYIILYSNDGDKFKAAAETRKNEIENSKGFDSKKDNVYMLDIGDLGTLGDRVNSIVSDATKKGFGLTSEVSFYTHGASQGPVGDSYTTGDYALNKETGLAMDAKQLSETGWGKINWNFDSKNSIAAFYGCNTAGFAERFLDLSNVTYTAGFGAKSMATYSNEGNFDQVGVWASIFGPSGNVYFGVNQDGKYYGVDVYSRARDKDGYRRLKKMLKLTLVWVMLKDYSNEIKI